MLEGWVVLSVGFCEYKSCLILRSVWFVRVEGWSMIWVLWLIGRSKGKSMSLSPQCILSVSVFWHNRFVYVVAQLGRLPTLHCFSATMFAQSLSCLYPKPNQCREVAKGYHETTYPTPLPLPYPIPYPTLVTKLPGVDCQCVRNHIKNVFLPI